MINKFTLKTFITLCIISLILTSCGAPAPKEVTRQSFMLDTIITLKYYGKNADAAETESINRLNEIDKKMSTFKPSSEISKINDNAGGSPVKVSSDTFFVIQRATQISKTDQGGFDISIGPLVNLWGIGTNHQKVPTKTEIDKAKKLVNYNDIILDKTNSTVKLKLKGQALDLGGIAKGYAADQLKAICLKHNITSAFLSLGGNVYAIGNNTNGTAWRIGIQDPLKDIGQYLGIITVTDKSVVTAGNYQRFFIKNGVRYHHLIDPSTGYPAQKGIISATIISSTSINCDALSNTTYILGVDKAIKLINSMNGVEAIFITSDKKVYVTNGLKDNFQLTNKEYNYEKGR